MYIVPQQYPITEISRLSGILNVWADQVHPQMDFVYSGQLQIIQMVLVVEVSDFLLQQHKHLPF